MGTGIATAATRSDCETRTAANQVLLVTTIAAAALSLGLFIASVVVRRRYLRERQTSFYPAPSVQVP